VGEGAVVELRGMARPFPALKALDLDEVIRKVEDAVLKV
jgi:hypothetical protein